MSDEWVEMKPGERAWVHVRPRGDGTGLDVYVTPGETPSDDPETFPLGTVWVQFEA